MKISLIRSSNKLLSKEIPLQMNYVTVIHVLVMLLAMVEATPPGIANNPSHSRCLIKKYKMCYNLEHVCPKFCPDSCTVECVSCKPICSGGDSTTSPPPDESSSPPPPALPSVTPLPPTPTPSPPTHMPSPPIATPSPPIATPTPSPPTTTTPTPSPPMATPSPPTTTTPTPSPPFVMPSPLIVTPSSPVATPSPSTNTPSSPMTTPPPPVATPSLPTTTPSPPVATPSPPVATPSPPVATPSPPSIPLSPPIVTPSPPTTTHSPPTTTTSPSPPTTTPSPPTDSPSSGEEAASQTRARCKNKNYFSCYNTEHLCPNTCPHGCEVDCVSCKPVCKCDQPGAVCQDPRFIGGDGITFYFHGKKDRHFCLVSDPNLHINAHFIGKRNQNMRRDFTWVQSIGILFNKHRLFIGAQNTSTWDNSIDRLALTFDDQPILLPQSIGATWRSKNNTMSPKVSITRLDQDTNNVLIRVDKNLVIKAKVVPITQHESNVHNYNITKNDCFAHLELGFKFLSLSDQVDGVLGQTYAREYTSRVNVGILMPVMGGESKFESTSMFATDCSVTKFVGNERESSSNDALDLPSLSCVSSMNGEGVVCNR